MLLVAGLFAGAVASPEGREAIKPFLVTPFYGVLMLFLLEMGLIAGHKLRDARQAGWRLVAFAIVAPIVQGALGVGLAYAIGLNHGRRHHLCRHLLQRILHRRSSRGSGRPSRS